MKPSEAHFSVEGPVAEARIDGVGLSGSARGGAEPRHRLPLSYRGVGQMAIVLDVALIFAAVMIAQALTAEIRPNFQFDNSRELAAAAFVAVLFITSLRIRDLYEPMQLLKWRLQLRSTMSAWCGAFLILASGLFASRIGESLSRVDLVLFWFVGGLALIAHRLVWLLVLPGAIRTGGLRRRQVALLCFPGVEPGVVSKALYRYGNAVSMLATVRRSPERDDFETQVDGLIASVRGQEIDEIYVAADLADVVSLHEIGGRLRVLPQSVTLLPVGSLRELLGRDRVDIGSTIAVEMQRAALSEFERAQKRAFDVASAFAGLMLLSPLLAATAVAIRLDSPGPVLFRQTRHGFNERPFKIYKFRTMRVLEDGAVIRQATANDPRVTRVGKILRRFSIDELPQLLNVLSGEMSLVGPRPHASAHDKHFSQILETYALRHHVKAGLTGWAQVNGARGETDTLEKMQRRVELDIWYINHWSLWLDFRIVMRTLRIVLTGENAH